MATGKVKSTITTPEYVEVVADGIKTVRALLDELYARVDHSKISAKSKLVWLRGYSDNDNDIIAPISNAAFNVSVLRFSCAYSGAALVNIDCFVVAPAGAMTSSFDRVHIDGNGSITIIVRTNTASETGHRFRIVY